MNVKLKGYYSLHDIENIDKDLLIKKKAKVAYHCPKCGNLVRKRYSAYLEERCCNKCIGNIKSDEAISITKDNLDILKRCNTLQKIKFTCEICCKEYETEKRNFTGEFLCKSCKLKRFYNDMSDETREDIKEKTKNTIIEKYGSVEDFNKSRLDKITNTNLEKYGVANVFSLDEFQEKSKQTRLEKYGNASYTNREKAEQTMKERYGGYTWQNEDLLRKCNDTIRQNYGQRREKIVDKVRQTKLLRYGDENYNNVEKNRQVCLERYGVESWLQVEEIRNKMMKKYLYDSLTFDSGWELSLWIYAVENGIEIEQEPCSFDYECEGKTRKYFPDFRYNGELIEIKGDQFIKNNKMVNPYSDELNKIYEAKHQCGIDNGVKFLTRKDIAFAITYVNEKYTKHFIPLFSTKFPFTKDEFTEMFSTFDYDECCELWKNKDMVKNAALSLLSEGKSCGKTEVIQFMMKR